MRKTSTPPPPRILVLFIVSLFPFFFIILCCFWVYNKAISLLWDQLKFYPSKLLIASISDKDNIKFWLRLTDSFSTEMWFLTTCSSTILQSLIKKRLSFVWLIFARSEINWAIPWSCITQHSKLFTYSMWQRSVCVDRRDIVNEVMADIPHRLHISLQSATVFDISIKTIRQRATRTCSFLVPGKGTKPSSWKH